MLFLDLFELAIVYDLEEKRIDFLRLFECKSVNKTQLHLIFRLGFKFF